MQELRETLFSVVEDWKCTGLLTNLMSNDVCGGKWPARGQVTNGCLKIYLFSSSTSRPSRHRVRLGETTIFGASDGRPLLGRASMMARPQFHGHRQLPKPMEARDDG